MFPENSVLKYNTLWRSGMHYNFIFFKVSHITKKGSVMGRYLTTIKKNEAFDHDYSKDRWIVDASITSSKLRRLPHPRMWDLTTDSELKHGICETSCVY